MKKTQRILIVILALCIGLLFAAGCARDSFEGEEEPDCSPAMLDEDYDGPTRIVLGIGRGAIAAARIRAENPDQYAIAAGIGGTVGLPGLLIAVETWLNDFENWPETPTREVRMQFIDDLFYAFGNPAYYNLDSSFYPPGTTAEDFTGEPKVILGFIDRLNTDGSLPVITFKDDENFVRFALALDQNQNGVRDAGEPLILQMHEDFDDENANGLYDAGEPYNDFGLDGVDGSGDFGESNGVFDYSPNAARFLEDDLANVTDVVDAEDNRNWAGAIYADLGDTNPWGFDNSLDMLFDELGTITTNTEDENCIVDSAALYNSFFWDKVYPAVTPFIPERLIWMLSPSNDSDLDPTDEATRPLRTRRFLQALTFLSARTPNWFKYKAEKESSGAIFENHSFISQSGYRAHYSIGLPAGYYDTRSNWKTYPVIYVLPDAGSSPSDWKDLQTWQGWLETQEYTQKTLVVILDPDREGFGGSGYSFFTSPENPEPNDIDADALFEEIVSNVESRFRANDK